MRRWRHLLRRLGPSVGLLAALQLAVLGARAWLHEAPAPVPETGKMMPATGGAIRELAIQFHAAGSAEILGVYHQLFRSLHRETKVSVVVGDEEDRRTFEAVRAVWFPDGGGPQVRYVLARRAITSWIHDRFVVLDPAEPGQPATLVAPPVAQEGPRERLHDWLVPWDLDRAASSRLQVRFAPFSFDGGDLIADEQHVFVTTRLLRRNGVRPADAAQFVRRIARATGRPVVMLGDERRPVPDHHIGMFLLPIGQRTVVVGDPDLAVRALQDAGLLPRDPGEHPTLPDVGGAPLTLDLTPARLAELRNVGAALEARGYTVVRVPTLAVKDAPYAFVSYTNAMAERRDGVVRLYLPSYGIEPLDRLASTVLSSLGARVFPIRVERIFRMGGTLGCLVAPLARSCEGSGPRGTSECIHGFGRTSGHPAHPRRPGERAHASSGGRRPLRGAAVVGPVAAAVPPRAALAGAWPAARQPPAPD